jgi:hypothetical protein
MVNTYKEYRNKELKYFIISEIGMFVLLNYKNDFSQLLTTNSFFTILISSPVLYFYCLILDVVVPRNLKNTFCLYINKDNFHMFFQSPGRTIFALLKENKVKDMRIDKSKVQTKYSDIFELIKKCQTSKYEKQNSIWYQIKSNLEKDGKNAKLETIEKEYLLFRDMLSMHIVLNLIYFTFHLFGIVIYVKASFAYIFVTYIVLFLCVRSASNKFVIEVIVQDLQNN